MQPFARTRIEVIAELRDRTCSLGACKLCAPPPRCWQTLNPSTGSLPSRLLPAAPANRRPSTPTPVARSG